MSQGDIIYASLLCSVPHNYYIISNVTANRIAGHANDLPANHVVNDFNF